MYGAARQTQEFSGENNFPLALRAIGSPTSPER
jgi:hypothetical protein